MYVRRKGVRLGGSKVAGRYVVWGTKERSSQKYRTLDATAGWKSSYDCSGSGVSAVRPG